MLFRKICPAALVALAATGIVACGSEAPAPAVPATLVITGARIWTGDENAPWAQALAVRGDNIVAVGSQQDVEPLIAHSTEVLDLPGAMVVPGFIDAHVHVRDGGEALASVQLREANSKALFQQQFVEFVKTIEPGEWILGGGWDHESWGGELPSRDWLDALTPDNPVWVHRLDGHMALANSVAMQLAGVDKSTADVSGGELVRSKTGDPTGMFKDNAMTLIQRVIPAPSDAQRDGQLQASMEYFAANGVTTVHDMADFDSLATYRRAQARGSLMTRIYSLVPLSQWQLLQADVEKFGTGDDWLKSGGLKGFMDGSLGSHTAAFIEPFTDTPGDRGFLINSLDDMRLWIEGADGAGLHIVVHAIGDLAIRELLDIYRDVAAQNGARDRRFRIEHAQHIQPDDIDRFASQGIIASMQPYHAIDDGRWAERVIGAQRIKTTYAFRALMDSGSRVAFGSDWYVAPASPLQGIYAAVTRRTLDGANPDGWVPQEKVSVEQALAAYTVQGAYASFEEHRKGRLKTGMLADFVVLDRDITAIPPAQIRDAQVLRTVVGGRTVYKAQ